MLLNTEEQNLHQSQFEVNVIRRHRSDTPTNRNNQLANYLSFQWVHINGSSNRFEYKVAQKSLEGH